MNTGGSEQWCGDRNIEMVFPETPGLCLPQMWKDFQNFGQVLNSSGPSCLLKNNHGSSFTLWLRQAPRQKAAHWRKGRLKRVDCCLPLQEIRARSQAGTRRQVYVLFWYRITVNHGAHITRKEEQGLAGWLLGCGPTYTQLDFLLGSGWRA